MRRFKWEPAALIVLVVGLGVWLVWGNRDRIYGLDVPDGARRIELRIGNQRGIVAVSEQDGGREFRVVLRNGHVSPVMDDATFAEHYGEAAHRSAIGDGDNLIFRLFNVTGWTGMLWAGIGLLGQVAFSGRMLVQWVVSEKRRESVVPEAFWWLSLFGGVTLFAYFVWRQDIVGVLGQSSGVVIYARNIKLIHKRKKALAAA